MGWFHTKSDEENVHPRLTNLESTRWNLELDRPPGEQSADAQQAVPALHDFSFLFGPAQYGEQKTGQNRNDGDDDKKLDERKAFLAFTRNR
jgi:hypothetical protein